MRIKNKATVSQLRLSKSKKKIHGWGQLKPKIELSVKKLVPSATTGDLVRTNATKAKNTAAPDAYAPKVHGNFSDSHNKMDADQQLSETQ